MDIEQCTIPVVIGYYPFRAKAQVLRLVCEYLHVPYEDRFFDPDEWNKFREGEARRWIIRDLPFLKHGDFVVTGNHAMITYVIELARRQELLGKTIEHKMKIDAFRSKGDLKDTILGFICNSRPTTSQEKLERRRQLNELYEKKISHLMELHEQECMPNNFYFGYLTLLDFAIYEIVNYFRLLFPHQTVKFTKLAALRDRVAALPEIEEY
jgi:glutathione S-transferase